MAQPLKWKVDWNNLTPTQRFFVGFPILGPQHTVYADLKQQLKARSLGDLTAWKKHPEDVQRAAEQVTEILKDYLGWPKSSVFLPDDPADIPFWDRRGDLAFVEVIMALEKHLGVELNEELWLGLSKMTFGEAITKIVNAKKAEPSVGGHEGISRAYWRAAQVAILFQILSGLLFCIGYDMGMLIQIWCFSALAFWSGVALIIFRRPQRPTQIDLFYIRWCSIIFLFVVTPLITHWIWKIRGVL